MHIIWFLGDDYAWTEAEAPLIFLCAFLKFDLTLNKRMTENCFQIIVFFLQKISLVSIHLFVAVA